MILTPIVFSFFTFATEPSPSYGEIYIEESSPRELPLMTASVGYGLDLNDSFSDMHSLVAEAQVKVWKYISTGVLYQHCFPQLSSAGSRIKSLEPALNVSIGQLQWGVFSLSQLQFILGEWNIMNLFPLQADFMIGGGVGMVNRRSDIDEKGKNSISYLWSVEQRFRLFRYTGIFVSVFGNTGGAYMSAGANAYF